MADQRKLVLSINLLLLCIGLTFAQSDIYVEPKEATVRNGGNVTLFCKSPRPIVYCRFELPNTQAFRVSPSTQNPDYAYYGNGFEDGDCGVQIRRVNFDNSGPVKCTMGVKDSDDEFSGFIDLVVGVMPKKPHFEQYTNQDLFKDNIFEDKCIVEGGRPGANITFYLDKDELLQNVSPLEETHQQDGTISAVRHVQFKITDLHNGKYLTCRAEHFAYPQGYEEATVQLRVFYPPVKEHTKTIYGLVLDKTAYITITVQANPRPETTWTIGNRVLVEGDSKDGFEAQRAVQVGDGLWNATLIINKLTLEDTMKTYKLKASNQLGQETYDIKISPSDAPTSDLDVGAVIGIVVACVILIVIIGLIIMARATRRWCFAGASHNTDIGPDSEAQISPTNDEVDEKTHEQYHPDEHEDRENKENGKHEINGKDLKTNTSV